MSDVERLLKIRTMLKEESRNALLARTREQKITLVARWKRMYCANDVRQLLGIAKDKKACAIVANWIVEDFDKKKER